jgi:hypothetical protein
MSDSSENVLVMNGDVSANVNHITSSEVKQVQLPYRRVHNRASFFLRQHLQSEMRQVEDITDFLVKKYFENPKTYNKEYMEVVTKDEASLKTLLDLVKRMMYFCGFSCACHIKTHENGKRIVIYDWKALSFDEQEKMIKHETSIMPTDEQVAQQKAHLFKGLQKSQGDVQQ